MHSSTSSYLLRRAFCLLASAAVLSVIPAAAQQPVPPAMPVAGFGIDGRINPGFSSGSEDVYHAVQQPDGNLLIAGRLSHGFTSRFTASGQLDTTYGQNGYRIYDFEHSFIFPLAFLPLSGQSIIGGMPYVGTWPAGDHESGAWSLLPDGSIQEDWGPGLFDDDFAAFGDGGLFQDFQHHDFDGDRYVIGVGKKLDNGFHCFIRCFRAGVPNTHEIDAQLGWLRGPATAPAVLPKIWRGSWVFPNRQFIVWGQSPGMIAKPLATGQPDTGFGVDGKVLIGGENAAAIWGMTTLYGARGFADETILAWGPDTDGVRFIRLTAGGQRDAAFTEFVLPPSRQMTVNLDLGNSPVSFVGPNYKVFAEPGGFVVIDSSRIRHFLSNGTPRPHLVERRYGQPDFSLTNATVTAEGHFLMVGDTGSGYTDSTDETVIFRLDTTPLPEVQPYHTGVRRTSSTMGAEVRSFGLPASGIVRYGTTPAFGSTAAVSFPGIENAYDAAAGTFTARRGTVEVTGLTPNTQYHYRVEVTTAGGTHISPTYTYTTPSPVLTVQRYLSSTDTPALPHGTTLDFGTTVTGTVVDRAIRIANTGNGKLWVDGLITEPGYSVAGFGLFGLSNLNAFNAAGGLEQGGALVFNLRLTAEHAGGYSSTFVIRSDDPFHTDYTINVTGVVLPANQYITWNPPGSAPAMCPLTLDATTTSGLPITYTVVSGPATLAGNVLTATGNGAVEVRATQPGNADWLTAPAETRIITFRAPLVYVTPSPAVSFGTTFQGTPVFRTVTITNGDGPACPMQLTGFTLPPGYDVPGAALPVTVTGAQSFNVRLTAAAIGAHTGSLMFQTSFGSYSLPLTGNVCEPRDFTQPDISFDGDGKVQGAAGTTAHAMVVLPDGKMLTAGGVGGNFQVTRWLATGVVDTAFGSGGSAVADFGGDEMAYAMAVDSAGRIVLAGAHTPTLSTTRMAVARFTAAGALDTAFSSDGMATATFTGATSEARAVTFEDGSSRVFIAGYVQSTATGTRSFAAALFSNTGGAQSSFTAGGAASGRAVYDLAASEDDEATSVLPVSGGGYLLGGVAQSGSKTVGLLYQITSTGTVETSFGTNGGVTSPTSANSRRLDALLRMPDGTIAAAGTETTASTGAERQFFMRVNDVGTIQPSFTRTLTARSTSDRALALALSPDGTLHAAGASRHSSGRTDFMLTRFTASGAADTTFGTGGSVYITVGSGSSEARALGFDAQCRPVLAGSAFTAVGSETAALVRLGQLASPLELWRTTHFGSPANSGPGANDNDPDYDGVPNLLEYTFGLQPLTPDAALQPQWTSAGGNYSLTFSPAPGVTAIAETSTTMAAGSWVPVPNTGTAVQPVFLHPATGPRAFLRLRVIEP